jgi:hypothetical protein
MVACNLHINEHHCTTEESNKLFLGEDSGLIDEINIFLVVALYSRIELVGYFTQFLRRFSILKHKISIKNVIAEFMSFGDVFSYFGSPYTFPSSYSNYEGVKMCGPCFLHNGYQFER